MQCKSPPSLFLLKYSFFLQELEYQLNTKQQILTSLKSFNGRLISSTSTFRLIDQDGAIQHVRHMLEQLSPSIEQLKQTSKTILNDWHEYNRVLIQMDKILRESEAELDRIQTSAITVETYEMSTKKAQVSQSIQLKN